MKGTTVAQALHCALKVKAGKKCTVTELAGALDTLAWAYSKGKKPVKRVASGTKKTVKRSASSTKARATRAYRKFR